MKPNPTIKKKLTEKSGVTSQVNPKVSAPKGIFGKHSSTGSIEEMNAAIGIRDAVAKMAGIELLI